MISTATRLVLILAVLGAVVGIVVSQYPALMDRASSLLTQESQDPPEENVREYEETRQAYQTFENLKQTIENMEVSQEMCVGSHEPLSDRVGHPFASLQSSDQTSALFMMLERYGDTSSRLSLYQMSLERSEDATEEYSIRNVERIDETIIGMVPCLMGYPQQEGQTPLERVLSSSSSDQLNLSEFTAEELEEAAVNKLFWHSSQELVAYSEDTQQEVREIVKDFDLEKTDTNLINPKSDYYQNFFDTTSRLDDELVTTPYQVPQSITAEDISGASVQDDPEETTAYLPDILEDSNHIIMKLRADQTASKRYLCFLASGDRGIFDSEGKLDGDEYKKLLESTVQSEDVEVCSP